MKRYSLMTINEKISAKSYNESYRIKYGLPEIGNPLMKMAITNAIYIY